MTPLAGSAIVAGLTFGFVVGTLRALLLPLAVLGVSTAVVLASRHGTSTEVELIGASFLAVFAVLAGVGLRQVQSRYNRGPGPPSPLFAPLVPPSDDEKEPPPAPPGFEDETFDEQDRITRRAWKKHSEARQER